MTLALSGSAGAQLQRQRPNNPPPNRTGQQQPAAQPDQRGTTQQPLAVNVIPTDEQKTEAEKLQSESEAKRSEDRELLKYTGYLVGVGLVQAIVFVFQLIAFGMQALFMRRTVYEMKRTARISIITTKATTRAANAARDAAQAAQKQTSHLEAAVSAELPSVYIEQLTAGINVTEQNFALAMTRPTIALQVRNYGRTPAFVTELIVNVTTKPPLGTKPTYFRRWRFPDRAVIEPNAPPQKLTDYSYVSRPPFDAQVIAGIADRTHTLWVYGVIRYMDFMDVARRRGFLFGWIAPNLEFIPFYDPEYHYQRIEADAPQQDIKEDFRPLQPSLPGIAPPRQ